MELARRDGLGWSTLADATAPDRVRPGAMLLAANSQTHAVVRIVAVDDDGLHQVVPAADVATDERPVHVSGGRHVSQRDAVHASFGEERTSGVEDRSTDLLTRPRPASEHRCVEAIFGGFVCTHDPDLQTIAGLERRHIEAFLAWTATRAGRGSYGSTRLVGPFVRAHAALAECLRR